MAQDGANYHKVQAFVFDKVVTTRAGAIDFGRYGPYNAATDVICASTSTTNWGRGGSVSNNNILNNLTIATGASAVPESATLTVAGDFTTSGGLIGKSALDFNAASNPYVDLENNAAWAFGTNNFTLEAWFRSDGGSGNRTIIANGDAGQSGGWLLYMQSNNNIAFYVNAVEVATTYAAINNVDYEDSKWHHVAAVRDGNDYLLYIDGKLEDKSTQSAFNLTHNGKASIGARDLSGSVDAFYEGQIAMVRVFKGASGGARTPAEIRADMFNNSASLADSTDLMAAYDFNEGTGASLDNIQGNTNFDGTITNATWAGAGTFTQGTSTVDLTGTGNLTYQGDIDFNILKCAAATKTTTIGRLSAGYININTNLYKGAGTLSRDGSLSWRWSWKTGTGAVNNSGLSVSGASYPVDLSNTYVVYYHDATMAKEVKWNYLINGTDTTLAANQETTGYWNSALYKTDIGDYELKCHHLKMEGPTNASSSQININAGNLEFSSTNGLLQSYPDNVFTAGPGARIYGSDVALSYTFKSQNDWSVVGNINNLNVTNEELKVTGQVINCTGDIHQYFPTIDHAQQLDADTADDRDVRLGRDLDKNTELINS